MKKNTVIYVIAFFLFVAGLGWLCYAGFSESGVYFLNVSEAKAADPGSLNKARLFGVVAQGSVQKNLDILKFDLEDKDNSSLLIPIAYSGAIPDTFKDGSEVIVEGRMLADGNFSAKTLMTKCPSKYQKENRSK